MDTLHPTNSNVKIIKSGYLSKRSKYLKLWKKRFIVLTNKHLYAFTSDDKDADCTMNLILKNCDRVEISDDILGKEFTFSLKDEDTIYNFQASSDPERNEWFRAIQLEISNPTNDRQV